jgi:hypothetical protein
VPKENSNAAIVPDATMTLLALPSIDSLFLIKLLNVDLSSMRRSSEEVNA